MSLSAYLIFSLCLAFVVLLAACADRQETSAPNRRNHLDADACRRACARRRADACCHVDADSSTRCHHACAYRHPDTNANGNAGGAPCSRCRSGGCRLLV